MFKYFLYYESGSQNNFKTYIFLVRGYESFDSVRLIVKNKVLIADIFLNVAYFLMYLMSQDEKLTQNKIVQIFYLLERDAKTTKRILMRPSLG